MAAGKRGTTAEVPEEVSTQLVPYQGSQKEAMESHSTAKQVLASIQAMKIVDDASFKDAADILKQVKGWTKELEGKRDSVTKPMNAALAVIRGWFKPTLDTLAMAEVTLKRSIAGYEQLAREKNEAAMKAMAEAAQSKDMAGVSVAVSGIVGTPKVAGLNVRKVLKWRVVDASLVPREYLSIDPGKVDAAVAAAKGTITPTPSTPSIPGIEFFEESVVSARA
jgi:hypothetical protein